MLRSIQSARGRAPRISHGVVSVVIADAAIAIG